MNYGNLQDVLTSKGIFLNDLSSTLFIVYGLNEKRLIAMGYSEQNLQNTQVFHYNQAKPNE